MQVASISPYLGPLWGRRSRFARLRRWARRVDLPAKLELIFAVLAVVMGITTYSLLSTEPDPLREVERPSITLLLVFTLIPILGLAALIARRFVMLWSERRKNTAGSRLQGRVILLFSSIAIVPTLLVAIFSSLLFEFGLRVWFSDRVSTVLNNAETVAEAYVDEHRKYITEHIRAMAVDLNRGASAYQRDLQLLQQFVSGQMIIRDLSEAIVFDSNGRILARYSHNVSVDTPGIERSDFERASAGDIVIINDPDEQESDGRESDRVQALKKLDNFFDAYLYVSRLVDANVVEHYRDTQSALSEYRLLESQRADTQLLFNIVLVLVSLAILLSAIVAGLWFATRLVRPIGNLLNAAERVRRGDMTARVPLRGAIDEIGVLSRAFNRMTSQLQGQTNELIAANQQLDHRRRFTEAVLEGVTAGVMGVDLDGTINLPNRSACELLEKEYDDIVGHKIDEIVPEMTPLLAAAAHDPGRHVEAQVNLTRGARQQNLLVQIAAETVDDKSSGYVVTFDDITLQLADQRRAAWADVARRIAHEIKNPLTPIQLSAERLRRKYSREVASDPEVFEQCTSTIIRQVNDLRRMVDEFSSFARMPQPVFHREDLIDILRQAMFLIEVMHSDIQFSLEAPAAGVELVCDRRLLAQAVTNLLKNATESVESRQTAEKKKHKPGEPVHQGIVQLVVTQENDTVDITISDNGRGLPKELRDRLFEPYVTTRAKGTGLGLPIVKKIVEDHHGQLTLEDGIDGGARAIMRFDRVLLAERETPDEVESADVVLEDLSLWKKQSE